jgi:hypothetical protein
MSSEKNLSCFDQKSDLLAAALALSLFAAIKATDYETASNDYGCC